jgi:hypothetical protein
LCIFEKERKRRKEKSREEHREAIFVLEHTSLRYDGKARKEENTSVNNE